MANFSESLTIRILGDSSQFDRELNSVAQRLSELRSQLGRFDEVNRKIERSLGRVSAFTRPLENVSRLIDRVAGQLRGLGRVPVTLNVSPALSALAVLSRAVGRVASQLRGLSAAPAGLSAGPPLPGPIRFPFRRFAEGGFVDGPAGTDRVPALLSAGEFVIREPAARQLGAAFLEALNSDRRSRTATARTPPPVIPAEPATVNNFGGVTIRVNQSADVNAIVRDLRFHGFQLRNRRG